MQKLVSPEKLSKFFPSLNEKVVLVSALFVVSSYFTGGFILDLTSFLYDGFTSPPEDFVADNGIIAALVADSFVVLLVAWFTLGIALSFIYSAIKGIPNSFESRAMMFSSSFILAYNATYSGIDILFTTNIHSLFQILTIVSAFIAAVSWYVAAVVFYGSLLPPVVGLNLWTARFNSTYIALAITVMTSIIWWLGAVQGWQEYVIFQMTLTVAVGTTAVEHFFFKKT